MFLTMNEKGEKIVRIDSFVDSKGTVEFMELMKGLVGSG